MNDTNNRMKGQRFVFNLDCNDVNGSAPPGRAQEWIRDWYRRAFAAGAGVLVADTALPDVVETKDTPTGEMTGARFSEAQESETASADDGVVYDDHPERSRSTRWYRTISELMAQGTDVLHLACDEGHRAGGITLGGMRMSDAHHGCMWRAKSNDPLMSQFLMDHPEWCNTWDGDEDAFSVYGRLDATLNYAVPEVQAHRLQILREMAANYDIDGLELDWMRWCRHFPAGTQREHLKDLTHFVGQVRAMLDEVAKAKGVERMILGHRVPSSLEESLNIGCDAETWARKGYADFLAPMDFCFNDMNIRTDEFVQAVDGTGCLVYPGFGSTQYSFGFLYNDREGKNQPVEMRSLDQFRATAANWYAWGAAGGSCFNMYLWEPERQEFYAKSIEILSDPRRASAGPRHYVYLPVRKNSSLPEHHGNRAPTGIYNAQMLVFSPETAGNRQVFNFRMADGRNGEKLDGILRFRVYDAVPGDGFAVDINGVPIHSTRLRIEHLPQGDAFEKPEEPVYLPGEPFMWPPHLRFEIALEDCPPFRGDNELGLRLKTLAQQPGREKNPLMEALEVRVK